MNNKSDIDRMKLNAFSDKDKEFNSSIKFQVYEYIGDEVPTIKQYNTFKDAIIEAYKLFLSDKLSNISIIDRNGNIDSTDALNYFSDANKINMDNKEEIENLKKENELMKKFLEENNAIKLFENFKSRNKI